MATHSLKKLEFLDALRGWAILLVLLVHCATPAELFGFKLEVATFGQRGVQLFYEVSAFSLLYSFYERGDTSWFNFFIRRFFRIAPLFYLDIGVNALWTVFVLKQPAFSTLAYLSGFTFTFGFYPGTINSIVPAGWSIAVETTFYALFPLLASRLRSLESVLLVTAFAMLGCFALGFGPQPRFITPLPPEYVQWTWFPIQFPVFCLGFVAYFLWRDLFGLEPGGPLPPWALLGRERSRSVVSAVLLLGAVLIVFASFPPDNLRVYASSLCFVCLLLALALRPWALLVNPVIAAIGRLSFSIYLVHPYFLGFVGRVLIGAEHVTHATLFGSWLGLLVSVAILLTCSLIVSFVTYRYVELPGIAFGKRLVQRRSSRPHPL